jgi:hypothetical protein
MVIMMPAGYNSWLLHQSSLAVLPAVTSGTSRRNLRRSENFAYQCLKHFKGILTCRKILHRTSGFTSHPMKGVLQIFIALKNPSLRPGLNQRLLGPVASTLTTKPPRRLPRRLLPFLRSWYMYSPIWSNTSSCTWTSRATTFSAL